jgi:hypothetical protein
VEAMIGVEHGDVDRDSRGEHDTGVDRGEGGHGGVGGEADGGGGGDMQDRGEITSSRSHPSPRSSSTSHRRLAALLVRFAGGGVAGGDVSSEEIGACGGTDGAARGVKGLACAVDGAVGHAKGLLVIATSAGGGVSVATVAASTRRR